MLRWELRELQQDTLLKKLFREAEKLAMIEEDENYYEFFRKLAVLTLTTLPVIHKDGIEKGMEVDESSEESKVSAQLFSMLRQIKEFNRTPEEGLFLVWKIAEKSVERITTLFTYGYGHQRVLEQEKVYGGHATEDAPDEEVQLALSDQFLA